MSNTIHTLKNKSLWSVEMRAFAVEKYLEMKSFDATIRAFVTKFNPRYIVMLEKLLEDLERLFLSNWHMWFQQDGASPHAANKYLDWLRDHFKSRNITAIVRSSGFLYPLI